MAREGRVASDADSLESWLDATPAVHARVTHLLGRDPRDATGLPHDLARLGLPHFATSSAVIVGSRANRCRGLAGGGFRFRGRASSRLQELVIVVIHRPTHVDSIV
jgi:hypothetical protein